MTRFATAHSRDRSVLVVDDDDAVRESLIDVLADQGYTAEGCPDGAAALVRLRSGARPDAIVLDLMMPGMDGWAFRVAQKNDAALATIPIVALSADWSPKAAAIDADAYLKKPIAYDALAAAIDNIMLRVEARELRVRLEEADRLGSLARMAAGVAHEINNPLAYTMMNIEHVLRRLRIRAASEDDPEETGALVEALERAAEGGGRVTSLLRKLVAFSCGSIDKLSLVDVRGVLESAIQMTWHEIQPRARLVRHMLDVPPVEANEVRLGQVFHALLTNAALAIAEGDPANNEVRVRTHCDADGRVVVEIADTGCGIAPDDLPHTFDPFFTTRTFGNGTGLGLSIAYGTVVALGGEMHVASTPGKGSVFEILLPAAAGMPSSRRMKIARPRLLVIEDDDRVAEAAMRALGEEYDVELARGARDALALFTRGTHFDAVLCELALSLGSGIDLYAETLRVAPQLAKRFVFLTSGVLTPKARAFVEGSGARCLEKPVDLSALREMLRSFR